MFVAGNGRFKTVVAFGATTEIGKSQNENVESTSHQILSRGVHRTSSRNAIISYSSAMLCEIASAGSADAPTDRNPARSDVR